MHRSIYIASILSRILLCLSCDDVAGDIPRLVDGNDLKDEVISDLQTVT
jgi:hypothetical protein